MAITRTRITIQYNNFEHVKIKSNHNSTIKGRFINNSKHWRYHTSCKYSAKSKGQIQQILYRLEPPSLFERTQYHEKRRNLIPKCCKFKQRRRSMLEIPRDSVVPRLKPKMLQGQGQNAHLKNPQKSQKIIQTLVRDMKQTFAVNLAPDNPARRRCLALRNVLPWPWSVPQSHLARAASGLELWWARRAKIQVYQAWTRLSLMTTWGERLDLQDSWWRDLNLPSSSRHFFGHLVVAITKAVVVPGGRGESPCDVSGLGGPGLAWTHRLRPGELLWLQVQAERRGIPPMVLYSTASNYSFCCCNGKVDAQWCTFFGVN